MCGRHLFRFRGGHQEHQGIEVGQRGLCQQIGYTSSMRGRQLIVANKLFDHLIRDLIGKGVCMSINEHGDS